MLTHLLTHLLTRLLRRSLLVVTVLGLAACAVPPQKQVDIAADYFTPAKAKPGRIGVVMSELPKPDTQFPGAWCLLCLAVANAANNSLNKEVQAFSTTELAPLPAELVTMLKARGQDAVLINEPVKVNDLPDFKAADPADKSRKDYSSFKTRHGVDRLLVVEVTALGVWRSYSSYVPTDPPKAVFNGFVSMIDLGSHQLDWFLPVQISRAADGVWDEPPKFPGLSNAYYQALEAGMDAIRKPLAP